MTVLHLDLAMSFATKTLARIRGFLGCSLLLNPVMAPSKHRLDVVGPLALWIGTTLQIVSCFDLN